MKEGMEKNDHSLIKSPFLVCTWRPHFIVGFSMIVWFLLDDNIVDSDQGSRAPK